MLKDLGKLLKGRVLILGVGNILRGDDGLGPRLVRRLKCKVDADLLDCGDVPENFLDKIAEIRPETVLIIDAVDFGDCAGSAVILSAEELADSSCSTHHASLSLFTKYLKTTIKSKIFLLGVQPKSVAPGSKMSEDVSQTLVLLQKTIEAALAVRRPE